MALFSSDSAIVMSFNTLLDLYHAKLEKKNSETGLSTGVVLLDIRGGCRGDYGLDRVKFPGCTR